MEKIITSIEESNVLAKILPAETADMFWNWSYWSEKYYDTPSVIDKGENPTPSGVAKDKDIIAWSLPALLGVLNTPLLQQQYDGTWKCSTWYMEKEYNGFGTSAVTATVNLILTLKAENLL